MEAIAAYKYSNSSKPHCPGFMGPDFVAMAERELSAFFDAVTQLFGSEQAELSADDWLREFIEIDGLPASFRVAIDHGQGFNSARKSCEGFVPIDRIHKRLGGK